MYPVAQAALFRMDPERAHRWVSAVLHHLGPALIRSLDAGWLWAPAPEDECEAFGMTFRSRLGLAAGFDKNAEILEAVAALGFGFTEIGTVTPRPQLGNPTPRLFREVESKSLWNRMGFNNDGAEAVSRRLAETRRRGRLPPHFRVGVNLGKNRDTPVERAAEDYLAGIQAFEGLADYFVINVSSPNTPGLRGLQQEEFLLPLARQICERKSEGGFQSPCLLKVAPELGLKELNRLSQALDPWIDGWVSSNTWMGPGPSGSGLEQGGWSGGRLKEASKRALADLQSVSNLSKISVGGISTASEARARLQGGAHLLQIYSSWVYEGPSQVRKLTEGLRK